MILMTLGRQFKKLFQILSYYYLSYYLSGIFNLVYFVYLSSVCLTNFFTLHFYKERINHQMCHHYLKFFFCKRLLKGCN